jgi:hypothetical protein
MLNLERMGSLEMRNLGWKAAVWAGSGLSVLMSACGGGTPAPTNYVLTVNSTNPASGVTIGVGNPRPVSRAKAPQALRKPEGLVRRSY